MSEPFCVKCHIYFIACSTFKQDKLTQSALKTGTFIFQVSKKRNLTHKPFTSCLYRLNISVSAMVSAKFSSYLIDTKMCSMSNHRLKWSPEELQFLTLPHSPLLLHFSGLEVVVPPTSHRIQSQVEAEEKAELSTTLSPAPSGLQASPHPPPFRVPLSGFGA